MDGRSVKLLVANEIGVLHIAGFVALTAVIGAMSDKHSADYVFVETQNATGWSSDGLAWMIGMLSTVYPFLGYVTAHKHKHKTDL